MLPRGYLLLLFKSNVIFDTLNYRLELGAELFYRLQDILIVLPPCNLSLDERFFCVFFPFNLSIYEKQLQVRENRYNPFENLSLAGFKFFMTLLDQSNLLPSCVPFIIGHRTGHRPRLLANGAENTVFWSRVVGRQLVLVSDHFIVFRQRR